MKDWQVTLVKQAKQLPSQTAGVYILFVGKNPDYVGQSDDVRRRLTNEHHVYDALVHDLVALIYAPVYDARLALERYFNQKYNPPNSYVGSEKQAGNFDDRYLQLSAAERRAMWQGPPFDEYDLPDMNDMIEEGLQIVLQSKKISQNIFQAPSVLSLPPEELLGF